MPRKRQRDKKNKPAGRLRNRPKTVINVRAPARSIAPAARPLPLVPQPAPRPVGRGALLRAEPHVYNPFSFERKELVPRKAHERKHEKLSSKWPDDFKPKATGVVDRNTAKGVTAAKLVKDVVAKLTEKPHPSKVAPPPRSEAREAKIGGPKPTPGDDKSMAATAVPKAMASDIKPAGTSYAPTSLANFERNEAAHIERGGEDGAVRVRHREYCFDRSGTATFISSGLALNPGNAILFPWFSSFAVNYDQYYVNSMSIQLRTVEATTQKGRLAVAIDYDMHDNVITTKAAFMQIRGATVATAWQNLDCHFDPASGFPETRKYIRSTDIPSADINLYDCGNLQIATDLCADVTANAEVWIEYDITLYNPNLENGLGQASFAGGFAGTYSTGNPTITEAKTGMFGTNPYAGRLVGSTVSLLPHYAPAPFTMGGVSFAAGNHWEFPGSYTGTKSLFLAVTYVGTALNTAIPSPTVFNCAVHTAKAADSKTASFIAGNGNAAANAGTAVTAWYRIDLATVDSAQNSVFQIFDNTAATCTASMYFVASVPYNQLGKELYGDPVWEYKAAKTPSYITSSSAVKGDPAGEPECTKSRDKDVKDVKARDHVVVSVDMDDYVVTGTPTGLRSDEARKLLSAAVSQAVPSTRQLVLSGGGKSDLARR